MSQSPVNVTYSIEEVLKQINQKLDKLPEDVTDLKVGQAKMESKLEAVENDIKEIKGSQKAQIWTLIGILATAVGGAVIRFVITALPIPNHYIYNHLKTLKIIG
ncbi:hypothetical protein PCC7424_0167 [Gloeothece citriformis PCC 7424]|uniref:Uncharacterized protein n=1 Tax=Gloeothece citriformis (strain PCC 7424) TaxID=65393 RepID=B7K9F4_GLOC7|nr:hemolysin XhlA family protein [Gloeothece citriformis]ACK68637.1 hypothetical protein PCC7424_0167 [Gloeothece citriformis PCC 7424]